MVLVTGGTGFLGAYIIRGLVQKGHQVRAIRRSGSKTPFYIDPVYFSSVEWVEGDILDLVSLEQAMEGIDTIIHAAAIVSFSSSEKKAMLKVNVEGTANVVNIALEKNVRRIVHISSVAALGRTAGEETVTEKKQWTEDKLNSYYAISKYYAELEVWRGIAEGLEGVILNPSIILGYGDWNSSSNAIFKNIYKGFPWFTQGINGFVFVEDVARAAIALMETDINAERFIINGENLSYQQVFNTIADSFEKKRPYIKVTPLLAGLAIIAARLKVIFSGKGSIITPETARVAANNTYYGNSKILQALPEFSFTPLHEAIRETCRQYIHQQQATV